MFLLLRYITYIKNIHFRKYHTSIERSFTENLRKTFTEAFHRVSACWNCWKYNNIFSVFIRGNNRYHCSIFIHVYSCFRRSFSSIYVRRKPRIVHVCPYIYEYTLALLFNNVPDVQYLFSISWPYL